MSIAAAKLFRTVGRLSGFAAQRLRSVQENKFKSIFAERRNYEYYPPKQLVFKTNKFQPFRSQFLSKVRFIGSDCYSNVDSGSIGNIISCPHVEDAFSNLGFTALTEAQSMAYKPIIKGENVIIAAETGGGKTFAFLLPVIEMILSERLQNGTNSKALIFCANAQLCQQVVNSANLLLDSEGKRLVSSDVVSAHKHSKAMPDIMVATPAGLLSVLSETTNHKSWSWEKLASCTRWIVFDEADLLFSQSFSSVTDKFTSYFKKYDRDMISGNALAYTEVDKSCPHFKEKIWKRQFLFVGATIPRTGDATIGIQIMKRFANVKWIETKTLHHALKNVDFNWREVDNSTLMEALTEEVLASVDRGDRLLLFCSSKKAAEQTEKELLKNGIVCCTYHSEKNNKQKEQILKDLRMRSPMVVICTDSAARGLDIPMINHVINVDFPTSAVDFLHRAGRTGRAGAGGRVTSLHTRVNNELAFAIKKAIIAGTPLEGIFSRNRSFRRKIRKYGKYVPRGALYNPE